MADRERAGAETKTAAGTQRAGTSRKAAGTRQSPEGACPPHPPMAGQAQCGLQELSVNREGWTV